MEDGTDKIFVNQDFEIWEVRQEGDLSFTIVYRADEGYGFPLLDCDSLFKAASMVASLCVVSGWVYVCAVAARVRMGLASSDTSAFDGWAQEGDKE